MANQKTMTGNNTAPSKTARSATTTPVSHVAQDVIELAELQTRLFKLDLSASTSRMRNGLVLAVVGAVVLCMGLLMALFVVGLMLVELADWDAWVAFGTVALTVLILSAILLFSARRIARKGLFTWERSRDELQKNLAWLKSTVAGKHVTTRSVDRDVRA